MKILTDVDNTILNFSDALQQYLEDEHNMVCEQRLRDAHNIQKLYGIDLTRTLELVASFQRSDRMAKLAPEPCAAVVLPELHRRGYQFVAISACLNEPATLAARQRNLIEVFGFEWHAIHCIGLKPCKKDALAAYSSSIWVDDLPHHAVQGAEVGHQAYLVNRSYNQGEVHPDVTRVANWYDLMHRLDN